MKKLLTLALVAIAAIACSKDDGVGSYAISGAPEITSLAAGYQRIEVTWQHNTSSSESNYSNIYWNGGNNSSGQVITSSSGSSITLEITNITEGEHTFYVQNVNTLKNQQSAESTPVTIYVYGDNYVKDLSQRTIASIDYIEEDDIEEGAYVTWSSFNNTSGAIGNMLYYCNQSNEDTELFCSIDDAKTLVPDAIVETELDYATLYCPEGCLDTLATSSITGETFPMSSDGIIRVASIVAMQPYFAMDDVHVILETGDYRVTPSDIAAGYYQGFGPHIEGETEEVVDADGNLVATEETGESKISTTEFPHSIFLVEGSNSIYDFGGSTVTIETKAYDVTGYESFPLRFLGNDNTVKNLTQIDDGELEAVHPNGITNIVMDGADNLLENVTIYPRGSYPYRYGELFGKGSGYQIKPFKHCGILVRGDRNHVLNCSIYQQAFGHYLFMQAAQNPIIEGLHVEGEMQTAEAVWAEYGDPTSPAAGVDFITVFSDGADGTMSVEDIVGYTFCLGEDGIRAYNSGNTIVNGEPLASRRTESITVKDCYVKNARAGISLSLAGGDSYSNSVTNTTVVGCDRNFAVGGSTRIVNCVGDAQYGPCYGVDYEKNGSIEVDITLITNNSSPDQINGYDAVNGSKQICYIQGSGHQIIFKAADDLVETTGLYIQVGGDNTAMGSKMNLEEGVASSCTIVNLTGYPVQVAGNKTDGVTPMAKNNTIYTDSYVYMSQSGYATTMSSGTTDSNGNTVKPLSEWSGSF